MCNTANKKAEKGSKYWMQEIVNNEFFRKELENKLKNESLEWISPLENESYNEYKLTEDKLKEKIPDLQDVDFSFWPKNGPEWDAIALAEDGRVLYLFEAKSSEKEMKSSMSATSDISIEKICGSMRRVCEEFYKNEYKSSLWEKEYYQMGNRLTFLYNMNHKMKFDTIKKVKLVLLNIVYDITHDNNKRTQLDAWKQHYEYVFEEMTGSKNIPEDVIMLYFHCGFC